MTCEDVREQLPDYALGSLSDVEMAALRRHLRGCSACRTEAATLDEGVAMFASAAHAMEPPPELRERVLTVLDEEWSEARARPRSLRERFLRWPAIAAAALLLAGALSWGGVAQTRANAFHTDAATYQHLLHALGGRDVRVAVLNPMSRRTALDGTAVVYDSDAGQSWALVLIRAPGYTGQIGVTLSAPGGTFIRMRPIQVDPDGEGSTWLVTSADLSRFRSVRITNASGHVLATGVATSQH